MSWLGISTAERERVAQTEDLFDRGATDELIARLADPSWVVRRALVSVLARLGDRAVEPLCRSLREDRRDEASIAAAVDALVASLGQVEDAALELARSPIPAVACDGAQILGRRRAAAALPDLALLVHHTDDNVALAALEAVGRIGGQPAVDLLIEAVESRSFFRAFPAIDLLGRTGDPRAVKPLSALLRHPHYAIEAARALGRTGQETAAAPLAALLARPDDASVRVVAVALVEIEDRTVERFGTTTTVKKLFQHMDPILATRRLTQAVVDADAGERAAICRVLGWLGGSGAIHSLVDLLDGDPETAQAAATALAGFSSEAEPEILQALRDSGSERRLLLLPIVGRRSSAIDDIVACLDDPNPNVRALACDALGRIADERAVPVLFSRLGDLDARVSQSATSAIQAIGGLDVERRAEQAARSGDLRVRRPALRILTYFGAASSLDLFLQALEEPDDRLRDIAANGLAAIDDEKALAALFAASHHASPRTRATAIRALGQTDSATATVRARLLETLTDGDAWVRYYAVQALSRIGDPESAEAVSALIGDSAGHVRVAVVDALARLRGDHAIDALRDALESEDADVVRAALVGAGIVRSTLLLPRLERAARDRDAATRLVAISALAEYPGDAVLPSLALAAIDFDDSVRAAAVNLIATRSGPAATRVLVDLLGTAAVRDRAVAALATPVDGRVAGIVGALGNASAELAPVLVKALAHMRTPQAQAAVEDAFALDNVHARRAVAASLSAATTPVARELLERGARVDPDVHVRRICAAVLSG